MEVTQVIPKDAIPSVDDPHFTEEYVGDPDDEMIVVTGETTTRAYPIRYLNYHEIVNDVIDGEAIAVTWCPLCGSAVGYDRTVAGRTLEFGVSGKLANDDLVMYDRQTESEWKQSTGHAINGPLAGAELSVIATAVIPYSRFVEEYPSAVVLAPPGGKSEAASDDDAAAPIEYEDQPYADYFESDGFGLAAHRGSDGREWRRDDLDPKAVILGVEGNDDVIGFPYSRVHANDGVAHATIDEKDIVAFTTPDGFHAFETELTFEPTEEPGYFAADGTRWDGTNGRSADGRSLQRVAARRLFAFAWQDDHGPDAFWSP